MLCQRCRKNPASTYVRTIADGRLKEYALCAECAQQLGCGNSFTDLWYRVGEISHEFFSEKNDSSDTVHCKCCGMSFNDIVRCGCVGCAECYQTFQQKLIPVIRQLHGSAVHFGKAPGADLPQVRPAERLAVRGPSENPGIAEERPHD